MYELGEAQENCRSFQREKFYQGLGASYYDDEGSAADGETCCYFSPFLSSLFLRENVFEVSNFLFHDWKI